MLPVSSWLLMLRVLALSLLGLVLTACMGSGTPTFVPPLHVSAAVDPTITVTVSVISDKARSEDASVPSTLTPAPDSIESRRATASALEKNREDVHPRHRLTQLASGGCCVQPWWSPDSQQVLFIDRPASRPSGIYAIDVKSPSNPVLVRQWIVETSDDGAFYIYPNGNAVIVQRASTGQKHTILNGGRQVFVSPDGQHLLWQVREEQGNFDQRRAETWISNLDGSDARIVAETVGFETSRWIDDHRVLLVGVPLEDVPLVSIATLTLASAVGDGENRLSHLAHVMRPRGTSISADGNWLTYYLTFQPNPEDDGLWIVPTDGSQLPYHLDFFGSYRWRDDTRLLYIPFMPLKEEFESHSLWQYDVLTRQSKRLTHPEQLPFRVANNDWSVSPDGHYMVFVSATDHNLWLLDLEP